MATLAARLGFVLAACGGTAGPTDAIVDAPPSGPPVVLSRSGDTPPTTSVVRVASEAPAAVAAPAAAEVAPAAEVASSAAVAAPTEGARTTTTSDCPASVDALPLEDDDPRLAGHRVLVVLKSARRLAVYSEGNLLACHAVGLGFAPRGHKKIEGDGRTPEGWYRTSDKPWSSFENAIAIHYPNADDARAAAKDGRISARTRDRIVQDLEAGRVPPQNTALGGAVLIHGGGSSADWTLGCVALDDDDLLELREQIDAPREGGPPRPKKAKMRTDLLILP